MRATGGPPGTGRVRRVDVSRFLEILDGTVGVLTRAIIKTPYRGFCRRVHRGVL